MHPEKQLERTQRQRVGSACPVKQTRALLKSNPPRDNWIEGDEIKTSPSLGRPKPPQDSIWRPLFQSLVMPQKNLGVGACAPGANQPKKLAKNSLSQCPFFRSKRTVAKRWKSGLNGAMGKMFKHGTLVTKRPLRASQITAWPFLGLPCSGPCA